jgi:predicted dehydrogenase
MDDTGGLGFGIVGLGNISGFHVAAIRATPGCRVVAVASSNSERRSQLAEELGAVAFEDYHEMLLVPELDVVCICTPSGHHLGPAVAAARAGKHVICEKPLEINVERAQRMIDACREAKVALCCMLQHRYAAPYRELCALAAGGNLGRLVLGNAYIKWYRPAAYYADSKWRGTLRGDGGAALINQGIHTIDLLLNVMGPVRSVRGRVSTLHHDIEGEDVAAAVLEFESGALGTIEGSTAIFAGFPERLEIHGDGGSAVLEADKLVELRTRSGSMPPSPSQAGASGASDPLGIGAELHRLQYAEIVEAIRAGRQPEVNGEVGLQALRVVRAIYESSRAGRDVLL